MYTDLYLNQKKRRLPYVFLVMIFFVVSAVIFFITQDSSPTRASRKKLLNHEIVNMSPGQIGIFWETDQPDEGFVIYGTEEGKLPNIVLDERDIRSSRQKRKYHLVIIKNIEPSTKYFYNIISDNEVLKKDTGEDFTVESLPTGFPVTNIAPIYGKMVLDNAIPATDAFAMVIIGNAYPIISLGSSTGEWLTSLTYLVTKETSSPLIAKNTTPITIQLFNDNFRSMVRSTPQNSRPIPQIITLGNNYSFMTEEVLGQSTDNTTYINEEKPFEKLKEYNFELKYPVDNALIPGMAPIIKGYGISGQQVKILINSSPAISQITTVNDKGEWNISLQEKLLPGKYTLTATSVNRFQKNESIKRVFTLLKSGERVLGEQTSTPSANLSPTKNITPTKTVNITITAAPTTTPKITSTPTPTIISAATPTLMPTIESVITTEPPVSGVSVFPYLLSGVGVVLIGIGTALFF